MLTLNAGQKELGKIYWDRGRPARNPRVPKYKADIVPASRSLGRDARGPSSFVGQADYILHLTYRGATRRVGVEPSPAYSALSTSGISQTT